MSGRSWLRRFRRTPAQWLARLRAGPVTPRLDARFRRWLAADEANETAYEKQELAWELTAELEEDAEIAALIAEAQQSAVAVPRSRRFLHAWIWPAAVGASIAAVVLGSDLMPPYGGRVHATGIGEHRTIVLPDQSRMSLNTATRVRVVYGRKARTVHLEQGEATFAVVRDSARPFEVQAARGTARALGTEFNVLSSPKGVTVAVLSGQVEVLAPVERRGVGSRPRAAVLSDGQEVTYSGSALSSVQMAQQARIRAWHAGRIAFEDLPLSDALAEFNRYSTVPIEVGDGSIAALRVSGVFRVGETEALLRSLEHAFGIRVQRGNAVAVLWPAEDDLR